MASTARIQVVRALGCGDRQASRGGAVPEKLAARGVSTSPPGRAGFRSGFLSQPGARARPPGLSVHSAGLRRWGCKPWLRQPGSGGSRWGVGAGYRMAHLSGPAATSHSPKRELYPHNKS